MKNSTCSKCGASIKNVVTIGNKPFGTTCAEMVLGVRLPQGFFGSYEELQKRQEAEKIRREKIAKENEKESIISNQLTNENWNVLRDFSKALRNARNNYNDWQIQFVYSVANQKFGGTVSFSTCSKYETMQEALENWNDDVNGSFPYLNRIVELSPKQQEIFDKILNK